MIAHAFGETDPWTVGVEEELFVVDPSTLDPVAAPSGLLDGRRLKAELHAAVLELNTGVHGSVAGVGAELADLRAAARRGAGEAGLAVAASATWPPAVPEEQAVTPEPGYLQFVEYAGPSARRQFCSGLHVHVGIESPAACMGRLEAVLPWLPLVLALSANSPYVAGGETGLRSSRAELLALLPRSGAPPVFRSYDEWAGFADRLVELGLADSYTRIWWDARPSPRFGTLELRMPDQPTRFEVTVAFAALLQAAAVGLADEGPAERGIYAQNRWAALRFGAHAELIHPDGGRLVPVPELLVELVQRIQPALERFGTGDLLAPLDGLAQADEQLELGRREGTAALCRHLIALT
ncbi:MAG: YbdK family carboxylate-amine ligase [Actinobacteria bacterium]|nr:YbdK family carboxylate-amine ligase [Actinomycetota bacterium]